MFKSNLLKITVVLCLAAMFIFMFSACAEKEFVDLSIGSETPYDYDLSGYIKLGKYKGVEIGPYETAVSDEELQSEIDYILDYYKTAESINEGTAADGDTVIIDYVGRLDGVEFEGGTADGYSLTLGSGAFIPGFESSVVGHNVGETFTISVTFPETYPSENLAGKEAEFEITMHGILVYHLPIYNDEFVTANFAPFTTVAELETDIRNDLTAQKEENVMYTKMDDALYAVMENSEIKNMPQAEVDRCIEEFYAQYTAEAESYNMTIEEYVAGAGITMEDFAAYASQYAENTVTGDLLMYAIARAEKINISDEEYVTLISEYIDPESGSVADLEAQYGKDVLMYSLICDKVYELLVEHAVELGA